MTACRWRSITSLARGMGRAAVLRIHPAIGGLAATLALASVAYGDDAADKKAAESLIKAFISTCVQAVPDLDRIEGTAKLFGWKEINGLEGTLLAPANPNAKGKSWLVQEAAEVPFMLAVTRAKDENSSISMCTVVNPYAPVAPVATALITFLRLSTPMKVEVGEGQRFTYWEAPFDGKDFLISLIDASPTNDVGINVSASIIENK